MPRIVVERPTVTVRPARTTHQAPMRAPTTTATATQTTSTVASTASPRSGSARRATPKGVNHDDATATATPATAPSPPMSPPASAPPAARPARVTPSVPRVRRSPATESASRRRSWWRIAAPTTAARSPAITERDSVGAQDAVDAHGDLGLVVEVEVAEAELVALRPKRRETFGAVPEPDGRGAVVGGDEVGVRLHEPRHGRQEAQRAPTHGGKLAGRRGDGGHPHRDLASVGQQRHLVARRQAQPFSGHGRHHDLVARRGVRQPTVEDLQPPTGRGRTEDQGRRLVEGEAVIRRPGPPSPSMV